MVRCVIFDADDTLVDYKQDATRAFHAALAAVGRDTLQAFETCLRFDYENWERIGLSDVRDPRIQREYHALYREHVRAIFSFADRTVGLGGRTEEAAAVFLKAFACPGTPVEGAMETVQALSARYPVYAATNGLTDLQHARLAAFPLRGVFVSEALGAIKPTEAFFRKILKEVGMAAEDCLMVGDSLSSDIAGARAVGMPCVLFDRRNARPEGVARIGDLRDLLLLCGPSA